MPLRPQVSRNHKYYIINWLHLVKLSVLSASVVKNGFSEWAHILKQFAKIFQNHDISVQSNPACLPWRKLKIGSWCYIHGLQQMSHRIKINTP
jgi:hypothetical protein